MEWIEAQVQKGLKRKSSEIGCHHAISTAQQIQMHLKNYRPLEKQEMKTEMWLCRYFQQAYG